MNIYLSIYLSVCRLFLWKVLVGDTDPEQWAERVEIW